MSEVSDLGSLSELLQDLSVHLRRLSVRQDGEPRVSTEPGWVDVPTSFRGLIRGAGREREEVQGGGGPSPDAARQQGDLPEGNPHGRSDRAAGPYKAAVLRSAAYFVTPVSSRDRVMAAAPGAAAGVLQQAVADCANAAAFEQLYQGNAQANARRLMENFGMAHPDAGVRLVATQKKTEH